MYLLKMPTSNNKMYDLMGVLRYPNCNESSYVEFHSVLMSELQPEYLLYGPHNWLLRSLYCSLGINRMHVDLYEGDEFCIFL